jgi:hypothetical protein
MAISIGLPFFNIDCKMGVFLEVEGDGVEVVFAIWH